MRPLVRALALTVGIAGVAVGVNQFALRHWLIETPPSPLARDVARRTEAIEATLATLRSTLDAAATCATALDTQLSAKTGWRKDISDVLAAHGDALAVIAECTCRP
jgi:hypothetical protein